MPANGIPNPMSESSNMRVSASYRRSVGHASRVVCWIAILCWTVAASASSSAAGEGENAPVSPATPASSPASQSFVLGNVLFALLHEFGHAIIRDFDVPLLGLEEESADTIAAVSLMLLDRQQPRAGFGEALAVTALAQNYLWKTGLEHEGARVALWAQHGLSVQRYARLACLLYGSDATQYGWVVKAAEMEAIRAENCGEEWRIAERAVRWLRDTYGIAPSQRSSRPATEISVKYAKPLNADEGVLAELIQEKQLLEKLATAMQTSFAFPEPLTLKLSHCRVPNAYWDDEYREVVLCYELMEAFAKHGQQPEVTKVVERFHTSR